MFRLRDWGFIKEGLLNYLALLGWSLSADEDIFTVEEMVKAFDVSDVLGNPARFDVKKAEAINGTHIRLLAPADFRARLVPYLQTAGLVGAELTARQEEILSEAAPLIQERVQLLGEAPEMLRFLFVADDDVAPAEDALKGLPENLGEVLDAAIAAVEPLSEWTAEAIQLALRTALVDGLGVKPRLAFGPVRTAISGRRISPPLFESMVILGKESSLARIRSFRDR